jgi:hypothetical protein
MGRYLEYTQRSNCANRRTRASFAGHRELGVFSRMWREFGVLGLGMSRHLFATLARFLLRIVQQALRLRNNIAIIFWTGADGEE